LSEEALLDALTHYYNRYRTVVEFDADDIDLARCRLAIEAIIKELTSRKEHNGRAEKGEFDFTRID
jgi:hypothetical protein